MTRLHPITPLLTAEYKTVRLRALEDTPLAFGSTYARESQLTDEEWEARAARLTNGRLRVEVSDDGPGFEPASSMKPGHGLDLLERRLSSLFGSSASLEMTARDGHTLIAMSLLVSCLT